MNPPELIEQKPFGRRERRLIIAICGVLGIVLVTAFIHRANAIIDSDPDRPLRELAQYEETAACERALGPGSTPYWRTEPTFGNTPPYAFYCAAPTGVLQLVVPPKCNSHGGTHGDRTYACLEQLDAQEEP